MLGAAGKRCDVGLDIGSETTGEQKEGDGERGSCASQLWKGVTNSRGCDDGDRQGVKMVELVERLRKRGVSSAFL